MSGATFSGGSILIPLEIESNETKMQLMYQ
jgi:hypothetical protein